MMAATCVAVTFNIWVAHLCALPGEALARQPRTAAGVADTTVGGIEHLRLHVACVVEDRGDTAQARQS